MSTWTRVAASGAGSVCIVASSRARSAEDATTNASPISP